MNIEDASQGTG